MTTPIDAPDGQSVTAPSTVTLGTLADNASKSFSLPPNTVGLYLVGSWSGALTPTYTVTGNTTSFEYPVVDVTGFVSGYTLALVTVVPGLDASVTISNTAAHSGTVTVVASTQQLLQYPVSLTGHLGHFDGVLPQVVNSSVAHDLAGTSSGQVYVLSTIPGSGATEHPPTELSHTNRSLATNGTVIAAPGTGNRLRLFLVQIVQYSGTALSYADIHDPTTGESLALITQGGDKVVQYPAQGFPISEDTALDATISGTAYINYDVLYITEAV